MERMINSSLEHILGGLTGNSDNLVKSDKYRNSPYDQDNHAKNDHQYVNSGEEVFGQVCHLLFVPLSDKSLAALIGRAL